MSASSPIPLARPSLTKEAEEAVLAVLRSGHLVRGTRVAAFEAALCAYLGVAHAVAVSNGTAALEVALAAVGVGPGDEVVLPDFTFPSLANAVEHLGATPVTVDVELSSFNASPEALLAATTARTKAVVPVHQFGLPAEVAPLDAAGKERGFVVVEDAACALGASRDGVPCGTLGAAGCFSFHPRKQLTTGEGGAVVTNDEGLFRRMMSLSSHGMVPDPDWRCFTDAGWNYRMSDVHAALAEGQLAQLDAQIEARRSVAASYGERLGSLGDDVRVPAALRDPEHTFQSFVVLLADGIPRADVLAGLGEQGVGATIGSYAIHRQPHYREKFPAHADLPPRTQSDTAFRCAVALPLFVGMTDAQVDRVVEALGVAIATALERKRRS